jgi:hypothetical protein
MREPKNRRGWDKRKDEEHEEFERFKREHPVLANLLGLLVFIQIALIIAKNGGWIDLSWWWVPAPIYFMFLLGAIYPEATDNEAHLSPTQKNFRRAMEEVRQEERERNMRLAEHRAKKEMAARIRADMVKDNTSPYALPGETQGDTAKRLLNEIRNTPVTHVCVWVPKEDADACKEWLENRIRERSESKEEKDEIERP